MSAYISTAGLFPCCSQVMERIGWFCFTCVVLTVSGTRPTAQWCRWCKMPCISRSQGLFPCCSLVIERTGWLSSHPVSLPLAERMSLNSSKMGTNKHWHPHSKEQVMGKWRSLGSQSSGTACLPRDRVSTPAITIYASHRGSLVIWDFGTTRVDGAHNFLWYPIIYSMPMPWTGGKPIASILSTY